MTYEICCVDKLEECQICNLGQAIKSFTDQEQQQGMIENQSNWTEFSGPSQYISSYFFSFFFFNEPKLLNVKKRAL